MKKGSATGLRMLESGVTLLL